MILSHLVPFKIFETGFSTAPSIDDNRILCCPLDDKVLGVHKVASKTQHRTVQPPGPSEQGISDAPKLAWEAFYPEGSINPSAPIPGGFSFYLSGPPEFKARLASATEAVLSYRVMLQDDWEWAKGGKLPGPFGGVDDSAYSCSGGRKEQRCRCIGLRPMWRSNGVGELYTYLPLTERNSSQQLKVPPLSVENPDYGISVGRGSFDFNSAVGNWITIAIRTKLNDIGAENGEVEVWIDGRRVISIDGLMLRESDAHSIRGIQFQTFFGGHTPEWASPKDQRAWFADITGVIVT
ncbi:polysaccharide lyase family 14 protein [Ephemerocybe angulata]|uniref:Polysaccharide lyase family 14 protein n=1 Tax=Ephemerocybe angulata TaxID=980116 RepID=A0A8H6HM18_9AGAR|nr:polysaccharide lyase family 14 protein [Tulosesus angulatus]